MTVRGCKSDPVRAPIRPGEPRPLPPFPVDGVLPSSCQSFSLRTRWPKTTPVDPPKYTRLQTRNEDLMTRRLEPGSRAAAAGQDFPGQAARYAPVGRHGRAVKLIDNGGGRGHRLFHVQCKMGHHVRLHAELTIGEMLDEHGPQ